MRAGGIIASVIGLGAVGGLIYAARQKVQQVASATAQGLQVIGDAITYPNGLVQRGGSSSWRANNPGNLVASQQAVSFGAYPDAALPWGSLRFAIFPSPDAGLAAVFALLRTSPYQSRDIAHAVALWTTGATDAAALDASATYAAAVARAVGATIMTPVSSLTDDQLWRYALAIRQMEGWTPGSLGQRVA